MRPGLEGRSGRSSPSSSHTPSPSQLVQIEHALAAVNSGATCLGIKAQNAIVLAVEKSPPSPLVDTTGLEKLAIVCPNIGIVYSGMGPDFRVLVARARKSAQAYWKIYGEYPPTRVLVQEVAAIMQEATQRGWVAQRSGSVHDDERELTPFSPPPRSHRGVRPFGVSLLVAGYDSHRGPSLYQVDPSGSYFMWKASAIGKNGVNGKVFLEKR